MSAALILREDLAEGAPLYPFANLAQHIRSVHRKARACLLPAPQLEGRLAGCAAKHSVLALLQVVQLVIRCSAGLQGMPLVVIPHSRRSLHTRRQNEQVHSLPCGTAESYQRLSLQRWPGKRLICSCLDAT